MQEGRDLIGLAQTGTGKTAAFALPIARPPVAAGKRAGRRARCRMLVLAPTRELAGQIADSFRAYGTSFAPRSPRSCSAAPRSTSKHAKPWRAVSTSSSPHRAVWST